VIEMERRLFAGAEESVDEVYQSYVRGKARLLSGDEPPLDLRAELARARALMQLGDIAESEAVAREAADLAIEKDLPEYAARAWAIVAEAQRSSGRSAEASRTHDQARAALEQAAQRIENEDMRRGFMDRPVFRSIRKAPGDHESSGEQRLLAIYDMLRILNSETDPEALLETMLDMALDVVQAERGLILLREGDGKEAEYTVRLARNLEKQTVEDAAKFSRNVVLRAGAGKAVLAVDTEQDDRLKDLKSVSMFGIRSVLCVPLRSRASVIGAVYLDNRREGALFSPDDLRFLEAFADHAALALENARIRNELEIENRRLKVAAGERVSFDNIIGRSESMQGVYDLIPKTAKSHLPVLIQGESGTGKELVARAIHAHSLRKRKPLLIENCAAIPESLLESELFGHVRGAFTGADRDHTGLFEQAHGGTLFLDEIGDMPPPMQARLLRVLQEGELRRVGGERVVRVDVRVVTATHRDLQAEVAAGRFREDLFYRLQVLVVQLPALRDRLGDIPLLVDHFLRRISRERGREAPKIRSNVISLLEGYGWPGNVRQLENHIQRIALLAGDGPISLSVIEGDKGLRETLLGKKAEGTPVFSLEHSEKEQIRQALEAADGNRTRAARMLGISRATIFRKIKEYGLV
jgi:Nif-specific regulatory protein